MLVQTRGPLAHLVERIHGMDEVAGSSPAGSTESNSVLSLRGRPV